MKRFKEKWNIDSNYQLVIIFIVFAITGSLSLFVSNPILEALSIQKNLVSLDILAFKNNDSISYLPITYIDHRCNFWSI